MVAVRCRGFIVGLVIHMKSVLSKSAFSSGFCCMLTFERTCSPERVIFVIKTAASHREDPFRTKVVELYCFPCRFAGN
eukprot:COSAG05_NODE_1524_length_4640_cov_21.220656_2_plen_78_part_00